MKMTTWTSEGEMKPRDVTLCEAFSIVFHDFICHGGTLVVGLHVTFKRPSGVLSLKESSFTGNNTEEDVLRQFYWRYYKYCGTYSRLLQGKWFSEVDSLTYIDNLIVFGNPKHFLLPIDYDESFRTLRVRMAKAALLNAFNIHLLDEPYIHHLLKVSFDILVVYLMLACETSPDNFSQFVTENYQLCS